MFKLIWTLSGKFVSVIFEQRQRYPIAFELQSDLRSTCACARCGHFDEQVFRPWTMSGLRLPKPSPFKPPIVPPDAPRPLPAIGSIESEWQRLDLQSSALLEWLGRFRAHRVADRRTLRGAPLAITYSEWPGHKKKTTLADCKSRPTPCLFFVSRHKKVVSRHKKLSPDIKNIPQT